LANWVDDALIDDYQLDVWRMAAGVVQMMKHNSDGKITDAQAKKFGVMPFLEAYHKRMKLAAENGGHVDAAWDVSVQNAPEPLKTFIEKTAEKKTRAKMLGKYCVTDAKLGQVFNRTHPKLVQPTKEQRERIVKGFNEFYPATLSGDLPWDSAYFKVKDVAIKAHAGTGSLGLPRYLILIEGKTNALDDGTHLISQSN